MGGGKARRVQRTKEGVRQGHSLDALHVQIVHHVRVQVEEDGHIHRLASVQALLFKTEALNLAEIWRHLCRCHTVCGHADDILVALVGRCIESQSRLSRKHPDFSLLGNELPWKGVRYRGVKRDADALGARNGLQSAREITVAAAAVAGGSHWLATPASCLAYLRGKSGQLGFACSVAVMGRRQTILYMGTDP